MEKGYNGRSLHFLSKINRVKEKTKKWWSLQQQTQIEGK
jgi:hypothetical protein